MPLPPAPLPDKLYAAIDGTGVPMTSRETAGRKGKGEDGRARTREVKPAVFFTQDNLGTDGFPVRDRKSTSVITTFEPAPVFADLVKAEGIRRGADHIRQFTIIGDGAAWIWGIATAKFPEATQIADLYHARPAPPQPDQVPGVHAARPQGRMACRPPGGPRLRLHRRHRGSRPQVPPGRREEKRSRKGTRLLPQQRPPHALPLVPLTRPVRRLRRRRGQLQDRHRQRLKQSGMHWTVAGADSIIALRCKEASSTWEAICTNPDTQTRTA